MMDTGSLNSGDVFSDLKDSYVIIITLFNIYPSIGMHKYTLKNIVLENPELVWNDRQSVIILCADGSEMDDVPEGLKALLQYVRSNIPTNSLTERIEAAVQSARMDVKWGGEYMYYVDKLLEERLEGREEGLLEGQL